MEADAVFFDRALRRIYLAMILVASAGIAAGYWWRGWRWALAFLLGAGASYLNFSWLHQAVEAIGPNARPTRKRVFVFLTLRYLLLGVAAYVIVRVFGVNAIAALAGLFVPAAAIAIEIFYELIHG
jgi:hypothetical protein